MHPIDIAAAAIEQSLANDGAYVAIPDAPGVIDALQDRADDWAEQAHGIEIGGRVESVGGIIIEYWNVFVAYAD